MASYADLQKRLDNGEVIILDGAIGTELQRMGMPMNYNGWSAPAMETHPDSVRQLHEDYISAGAEVITTNTYTAARHVLEIRDNGDQVADWNTWAVELAFEARERVQTDWPVYVAGSVSILGSPDEDGTPSLNDMEYLRASCTEQVGLLKDAGVDLLILEMLETSVERVKMAVEIAREAEMPAWTSVTCMIEDDGSEVLYGGRESFSQPSYAVDDITFVEAINLIATGEGSSALMVFHSQAESTGPALEAMKRSWNGVTGAYANSGYWVRPNWQYVEMISPAGYLEAAKEWVSQGAQIIGGCCGVGLQHVELLREGLPKTVERGLAV